MTSQKLIFVFIASFLFIALFATNGEAETCRQCKNRVCGPPCSNPRSDACKNCKRIDIPKLCPQYHGGKK
uniref:Uncharacterized protein n=1 Tax=Meloidogyne hapla TaxID=6305 RepID=A0A1I8B492_MELHA